MWKPFHNGSFQPSSGGPFLKPHVRVWVCVKLASAMQSIKAFCISGLWKADRCPAPLAQLKTVRFKMKLVRKSLISPAHAGGWLGGRLATSNSHCSCGGRTYNR